MRVREHQGDPLGLGTAEVELLLGGGLVVVAVRVDLYRRAYEVTFMIQGNAVRERRRSGVSAFHASQQASTMAS